MKMEFVSSPKYYGGNESCVRMQEWCVDVVWDLEATRSKSY
jgi:hypothetical protein